MSNYDDWFSDNKFDVITQFAIMTNRSCDKDSLVLWDEEFPDEIEDLGREMFKDECNLVETNETIINQIDRGVL